MELLILLSNILLSVTTTGSVVVTFYILPDERRKWLVDRMHPHVVRVRVRFTRSR